jgi:GT2 family glycosyltransferase
MDPTHAPQNPEIDHLPFDLFERYELTRRLVPLLVPTRGNLLQILDVGGHSSPLKHFLPRERVFLADLQEPGSLTSLPILSDGYVRADGTQLPFKDDSFDIVTSHDTLEHLPPDGRPAFLSELFRVARRFVIVNGPVSTPETVWAEQRLSSFLERVTGATSQYLEEHRHLGLPETQEIERVLSGAGLPYMEIQNGNLWVWLALNAVKNYFRSVTGNPDMERIVDETANRVLCMRDIRGTRYRSAYVVAMEEQGEPTLGLARRDLRWEPVIEDQEALSGALRAMEDQVALVSRGVNEYGDPANLEPVFRTLSLTILTSVAPHLIAQANLERLLERMAAERRELSPSFRSRVRGAVRRTVDRMAPWGTRRRSVALVPLRAFRVLREEGFRAFLRYTLTGRWINSIGVPAFPQVKAFEAIEGEAGADGDPQYEFWLRTLVLSPPRMGAMRREARRLRYRPTISVVMPVHDPRPEWLRDAIESVRSQVYGDWELCIADDGSTRKDVRELLGRYEGHPSIKVTYLERNLGIAGASNAALALATGEFVGLLDHDDVLKPNALFEVAKLLNQQPNLDYLYSDEDKQEMSGALSGHFFKPDWSPDLLMSVNYVTHFSVYRRSVLERVGGFRDGFHGSQDYDLVLRVAELTDRIGHVPVPIYSWRKVPGSAAASIEYKDYAWEAGRRALQEAARRKGYEAEVLPALARYRYRVRYEIKGDPRVTIVIPTRDRVALLRKCIESIRTRSTYLEHEIVVIDNESEEPATHDYLKEFGGSVVPYPHPFNYSKLINFAAREVGDTDFFLFLNNDTEVITEDWIQSMVELGQRSEVGVVGARLLFPDGTPQHEGIVVGPSGGLPGNLDHKGAYDLGLTIHNRAAVTFACALIRPEVFWAMGGLDESFQVAYQDVDFCLRAAEKGYWVVYTPHAVLYHDEGGTRGRTGKTHPEEDTRLFLDRWRGYRDPFYNPNLDPDRLFRLQVDPRRLPHLRVKP